MIRDIHTAHCCPVHGCKYNDETCTVLTKQAPPEGPCEDCVLGQDHPLTLRRVDLEEDETYGVLMSQPGACDHSIGCGMRFRKLKARTLPEAQKEAQEYVQGKRDPDYVCGYAETFLIGEGKGCNLDWAKLVVVKEELPVRTWHQEILDHQRQTEAAKTAAQEQAELERLAAKLGKKLS